MRKFLFYQFFFTVVIFSGCKSKTQKAADEIFDKMPETTNMNAGTQHYNLYVPNGWATEHTTYRGVNYYFLRAPQTKADPNTSINVTTEYMQNLSLDKFLKGTINSVKRAIPSAIILRQGDIIANGLTGKWYSYTMAPQGITASLVSYIFPKNGISYAITAGTQLEDASRYRSTFDSVARSLKFDE